MSAQGGGGVCSWGCVCSGWMSAPGGSAPGEGVSAPKEGGVYSSMH